MADSRQKQVADAVVAQLEAVAVDTVAVFASVTTGPGATKTTQYPVAQVTFDDAEVDDSGGFTLDTHVIPMRIAVLSKSAEQADAACELIYNLFQASANFATLNAIGDGVAIFPRGRGSAFEAAQNAPVVAYVDYDVHIRYIY